MNYGFTAFVIKKTCQNFLSLAEYPFSWVWEFKNIKKMQLWLRDQRNHVEACLAACISVVDKPVPFCGTMHGAPGIPAVPPNISFMAEAGDFWCPEADPGTRARAPGRRMFTRLQVVGGRYRVTSQRMKYVLSESDLIPVECKGRTLRTNFKSLSGIFFRFYYYHWSIFF